AEVVDDADDVGDLDAEAARPLADRGHIGVVVKCIAALGSNAKLSQAHRLSSLPHAYGRKGSLLCVIFALTGKYCAASYFRGKAETIYRPVFAQVLGKARFRLNP